MGSVTGDVVVPAADSTVTDTVLNTSMSPKEMHEYLRYTEDQSAMELLPALFYMGVLAVMGDVGNAITLLVYYKRFKPSSTRTYILTMSVLDILFSTLSLPGEILDLRFSLTYDQPWLCRAHRFNTVFLTVGSGFILVAVALDRRRKICRPFREQLSARRVTLSVVGCMVLSAVISVFFAVLNGRHTVETSLSGVRGSACSIDDMFLNTHFPLIYSLLLALVFVLCVAAMVTSYVQIGRKIVKHKRKSAGLHGTMLATFKLVDRLESGDGSADGDPPLSPSSGDNDDVFIKGSDSVSSSSVLAKRLFRVRKASSDTRTDSKMKTDNNNTAIDNGTNFDNNTKADSRTNVDNHTKADNSTQITSEPATCQTLAQSEPPACTDTGHMTRNLRQLLTESEGNHGKAGNGKLYRTQSEAKREADFEMAVQTLAHAVSEDVLRCSGLLWQTPSDCQVKDKRRSASVGQLPHGVGEHAWSVRFNTAATTDTHHDTGLETSKHPLKCVEDIQASGNGPFLPTAPNSSTQAKLGKNENQQSASGGNQKNPRPEESRESRHNNSVGSHVSRSPSRAESVTKTPTRSLSHLQRFHAFVRGSLTRDGSLKDEELDNARSTLRRRHRKRKIPSRTTWMMFILTAIFVISYLPYLAISGVRGVSKHVEVGLTGWRLNLYNIALRSYFINSVVNPIVYSFCSARFRHQCRHLLARIRTLSFSE